MTAPEELPTFSAAAVADVRHGQASPARPGAGCSSALQDVVPAGVRDRPVEVEGLLRRLEVPVRALPVQQVEKCAKERTSRFSR
ncbi:hypothetical protein ACFV6E_26175 [Streptomyces sp. NPDC059785]|uniref:hypothetical protein n=1 Tax=unclassified Streptomyces TaxID=2593676 RepID=UPI00366471F8